MGCYAVFRTLEESEGSKSVPHRSNLECGPIFCPPVFNWSRDRSCLFFLFHPTPDSLGGEFNK